MASGKLPDHRGSFEYCEDFEQRLPKTAPRPHFKDEEPSSTRLGSVFGSGVHFGLQMDSKTRRATNVSAVSV